MREPRLFRGPNKEVLTVDVTLLHFGLCKCRSIAEAALAQESEQADMTVVLEEIIDTVQTTMHDIEDSAMLDEVQALLAGAEGAKVAV